MALSQHVAVFALLVLCFAVAPSTQKFTLRVDEVYPNFGPTVEILELSSGFMDTEELDVSTLRVQSSEGVTITTSGGISLDGASFSSTAGNVALNTTSSTSVINVVGANALDFFGNTVDFSSSNGNIELHAEADMQFIGIGTFDAQVDNFNSIGDNIAVSAAAGAITFSMSDNFSAQGSNFAADGINGLSVLAAQSLTLESVFNNLDVNGKTVSITANTLAVNADRNNVVLAAASTLSGSFDDITVTGPDGVYIVSMESSFSTSGDDVTLNASSGDISSTALFEAYFESVDASFTSNNAGTRFVASSGMVGKFTDDATFTAVDDITFTAREDFSTHSSQGDITLQANGQVSFTGDEVYIGSDGSATFTASDDLSINAVAGIYLTAAQSIVYGSQLPTSVLFPISITSGDSVELGGATVQADVNELSISGDGILSFTTHTLSRDSTLQMVAADELTLSADDVTLQGGAVSVSATNNLELDASDISLTTGFQAFGAELTFNAGGILFDATDSIGLESGTDMLHNVDGQIAINATNQLFDANRNGLVRSTGDAISFETFVTAQVAAEDGAKFFSLGGDISFTSELDPITIDSDGTVIFHSNGDIVVDADDDDSIVIDAVLVNVHAGTNVGIDSASLTLQSTDGIIAFAGDNEIVASNDFVVNTEFVFWGSPPGQDITFSGDITVGNGNLDLAANNLVIDVDDFSVSADSLVFMSGDQKPINIESDELTTQSDLLQFSSSDDVTFSTDVFAIALTGDYSAIATFDILSQVSGTYDLTGNDVVYSALAVAFNTADTHSTSSAAATTMFAETISLVSSSGDISITVGTDFMFDSGTYDPTQVTMTATDDVVFTAVSDISYTGEADWLQFSQGADFTSAQDTTFSAVGNISFLGSTIDHAIASLTSDAEEDMNVFGRDVELHADVSMTYTFLGDILIDGSTVTLSQTGTGTVTNNVGDDAEYLSNGILNFFAGGDFYLSSALASNPPTESAIIITTSARSAGISGASLNLNMEADGSISFLATDYATGQPGTSGGVGTNSGGFDVNVLAEDAAEYRSDYVNGPTSGVQMLSDGAAYDRKLAINTGALFRSLSAGNIQLTSPARAVNLIGGDSVSFEAERGSVSIIGNDGGAPNSISSSLGDIVYENLAGTISFTTTTAGNGIITATGYGTIQSGDGGMLVDAQENSSYIVAGDFDLQADRGRIAISQTGAGITIDAFNVLFEGADSFNWELGSGLVASAVGSATNCEGGNTVSADCNDVTIFGDTGVSISAATDIVIEALDVFTTSSTNNDVSFTVDNSVISVTGSTAITGGDNAEFLGGDAAVNAADILFTTQGSHWISAEELLFTSVADQLISADHSLIVEASSEVSVEDAAIATIYAGGLGRPFGIEVNADSIEVASEQDISVASESFRSLSIESTLVEADNSLTIHSLGTPNLGNDIFFESAESVGVTADTQLVMTASNILLEFDTNFIFEASDTFINSRRAVTTTSERTTEFRGDVDISADDVSFVTFLRDPVDSVTGDSTSATGNLHANEWRAAGDITIQSADDMTYEADGIVTIRGDNVEWATANSNSDVSFETLGKLSDIFVRAGGAFDAAATRVDITSVHSTTFSSTGSLAVNAGDSLTSIADGDTIFSSGGNGGFSATGDLELTSTGRMVVATGGPNPDLFAANEILIDADKDVAFEMPYRFSEAVSANLLSFLIGENVDMLFGADFRFSVGGDANFFSTVLDISVDGVFQDNNDGLSAGDQTFGYRVTAVDTDPTTGQGIGTIEITSNAGNIEHLARDDINVDGRRVGVFSASLSIEAQGPDGLTLTTSETFTDIWVDASGTVLVVADENVGFHGYGDETGVGTVSFTADGSLPSAQFPYDFVEQPFIGLALVSDQGDVSFNARQAEITHMISNEFNTNGGNAGQNNTASYFMNPGVNGTLTIASYGSDSDGYGFSAHAAATYLVSEHNIVIEGQNVRFEELGLDPYYYTPFNSPTNYNYDFYDLQSTRAVVYGYSEQDWTAAGANKNGNGVEIISSVPFEGVRLDSYFVGLSAGGGIRLEAARELSIVTEHELIVESESSIIIEAHSGSDENIGIFIATTDPYNNGYVHNGHVQFHAEQDLLLDAAGRMILESDQEIRFSNGPAGNMVFNSDSGFYVDALIATFDVAGSTTFRAAQDIVISAQSNVFITGSDQVLINGSNAGDTTSDVIFGNPNLDTGTFSDYNGVDSLTGNVLFDANDIVINAAVFDISQTAALVLPEELTFAGCGGLLPGSVFINYSGTLANLIYCDALGGPPAVFPFNVVV